jgi:very-short-patch-repair endonuclease
MANKSSPLVGEVASPPQADEPEGGIVSDRAAKSGEDDKAHHMIDRARKLRKELTDVEVKLWCRLRRMKLGVRFRRQCPIGPYVADFACHDPKLIVELDGGQHSEPDQLEYDERRSVWLQSQGFEILRYWNFQINEEMEEVVEAIEKRVREMKNLKGS